MNKVRDVNERGGGIVIYIYCLPYLQVPLSSIFKYFMFPSFDRKFWTAFHCTTVRHEHGSEIK